MNTLLNLPIQNLKIKSNNNQGLTHSSDSKIGNHRQIKCDTVSFGDGGITLAAAISAVKAIIGASTAANTTLKMSQKLKLHKNIDRLLQSEKPEAIKTALRGLLLITPNNDKISVIGVELKSFSDLKKQAMNKLSVIPDDKYKDRHLKVSFLKKMAQDAICYVDNWDRDLPKQVKKFSDEYDTYIDMKKSIIRDGLFAPELTENISQITYVNVLRQFTDIVNDLDPRIYKEFRDDLRSLVDEEGLDEKYKYANKEYVSYCLGIIKSDKKVNKVKLYADIVPSVDNDCDPDPYGITSYL